jgi:iron/zinc/copper transport system permease protein
MLVVPAVVAFLFTRNVRKMVFISWGAGMLASLLGLYVSYAGNFPTGPAIVCMYGLVLLAAGMLRRLGVGRERAADTAPLPAD